MSEKLKSKTPSDAATGSVVCPQCKGFGIVFAAFNPIKLPCDMCAGSGKVGDPATQWRRLGIILKDRRLKARLGLREAARLHGIDPSNLSKMERGCICPRPLDYPHNEEVRHGAKDASLD